MSDAKKPKISKKKLKEMAGVHAGHRDASERLSAEYYLLLSRTSYKMVPQILDMDRLTEALEQINPVDFLTFLHTPFGQGFLLGVLHQAFAYQNILDDMDEDEDLGEDGDPQP